MGWGWCRGWGPWPGRGRFWGRGFGWYPYYDYPYDYPPEYSYDYPYRYSPSSELRELEAYKARIEDELKEINRRIDELKRSMEK